MAFALFGLVGIIPSLAAGQQLAKAAIGGAVARIDPNIRRAVHQDQARTDQKFWLVFKLVIFKFLVSPHHAGQRVMVGNADNGKAQLARPMHIILRMRSAAQEREIRRDSDFGITRHWRNAAKVTRKAIHTNSPCTNQLEGAGLPSSFTSSLP